MMAWGLFWKAWNRRSLIEDVWFLISDEYLNLLDSA